MWAAWAVVLVAASRDASSAPAPNEDPEHRWLDLEGRNPNVKTVISIPDSLFRAAERAAKRLGVSRSEFYQRAISLYLQH